MFDRVGQELINLYPLPNANNPALGYNYTSEPVRSLNEGKFDIRVDENISTKDTLFARFSYDQASPMCPAARPDSPNRALLPATRASQNHARNAAISETHLFSPNTVNQMSFGFNRIFDYITSQGTGSCISHDARDSRRQLGWQQLRSDIGGDEYLLVARRPRLYAVRGRHERLDVLRFAGHGSGQPRHPGWVSAIERIS